jgi:hypothetical protein
MARSVRRAAGVLAVAALGAGAVVALANVSTAATTLAKAREVPGLAMARAFRVFPLLYAGDSLGDLRLVSVGEGQQLGFGDSVYGREVAFTYLAGCATVSARCAALLTVANDSMCTPAGDHGPPLRTRLRATVRGVPAETEKVPGQGAAGFVVVLATRSTWLGVTLVTKKRGRAPRAELERVLTGLTSLSGTVRPGSPLPEPTTAELRGLRPCPS